ncbi:serine protease [Candidatus Uhrbacteria bacterium]|nr:serine protease [Candidatus Uhrbacteria bacterium]
MPKLNLKFSALSKDLLFLLLSVICGGLAGGLSGFYASSFVPAVPLASVPASATSTGLKVVAPTSTFALVQVERPALASVVPPAFLKRRASAVGTLYRAPKATNLEDRLLTDDRMLGQAVAVTSDGWFVTAAAALTGLKSAEVVVWYSGASYPIERGIVDRLNDTVYLKVAAKDIPAASFAHTKDLLPATETWSEYRPSEFEPHVILDLGGRSVTESTVSSEVADRRIVLDGRSGQGDLGGGVWDANGQLLGIVMSAPDEQSEVMPATSIAASLSSLLGNGEIKHAYLGVRAFDLAELKLSGDRGGLPSAGALIRDDKKNNRPGIAKDSPAAKSKLQVGDVILKVERDILDGTADLGEVLSEYRPNSNVTLRVLRDKTDMDVQVTLGSVVTSEMLK